MLKDQTYKATKTGQRTLYISGSQVSDYIAHGWTVQGTGITPATSANSSPASDTNNYLPYIIIGAIVLILVS